MNVNDWLKYTKEADKCILILKQYTSFFYSICIPFNVSQYFLMNQMFAVWHTELGTVNYFEDTT